MFVKFVVVLLLLIALVSLLRGAPSATRTATQRPPARALMTRIAGVLLVLGLAMLALHLSGCTVKPAPFHATEVRDADFGRLNALETLVDHRGSRLASVDFSGKVVVVFFGYAACPDICPTTLATLKEVMQRLGADADRVQVFFVTLDPERDTPEVIAPYVTWFDARFRGLRGDPAATRAVAKAFRVTFSKVEGTSAAGYSLDHSATSYAYDPQGRLRLLIRHGETAEHIAADLSKLLAGR